MHTKNSAPRAKKSLGQHFLRQPGICLRIAALLHAQEGDKILEIGPGPGALTRALEQQPHTLLLLLEKDAHWARERQKEAGMRTQSVLTDALRFDWRRVTPENPWKIAGNLPYNVASPLIWDIVSLATGWTRAVFMVQKEVGQRLAAQPGTASYGALSVWVQSFARPRLEFTVGPGAFLPPPKVDSAVLTFLPRPPEERPAAPKKLSHLLRICFQQRRKQLGGIFRRCGQPSLEEAFFRTGLSPTLRPENLSREDFQRLAFFWASQLDKESQKVLS
ncbi:MULTISPECIES: 16S rRNA (adenine(1518)-N(6)/adenine(1519)-N(6))-dimethyltransferase RsmA [unclassified Desulfovibrio]|uniref:16S rRNA (adenine(1518)-N(6)/adenine(1519)-N(6))- dimethyltransferase RsmA n=1 Tax=unclassified Desulfovibrio TaxID=2593640 RepID=UPI000F5F6550|nr:MULTISPECIES: 16S rRNA (adenine(1518)-N(6)/adenine(1519)-N(6))-dimethyltransferase RsmA [unclassified Desulfovibrio]RRD71045.1 16S rRNA (adenine(1518)-N(6)/adenine(1519)-N(6))-dimethyltransferase RsmA [Desulfovibrio sp. OH1209_COT-279]RRD87387.1 16S rRNA (adenine(1518)-N(6)/adenine(1519)-N(6))-dimethyltransferase RsmA [Desulfovibrio sp. OH1186_COT-070]